MQSDLFTNDTRRNVLAVARGDRPAAMLLKNCSLVNVFSSEIIETNIALQDGLIAAVGGQYNEGVETIDLTGRFVTPGLIDAHLHIESTLLLPSELARVIVAHGTTCVINDPHEIANVLGVEGVTLMLDISNGLPCDFFSTAPSCVPATAMETTGGSLTAAQISELFQQPGIVGLGEMMNYPGVISGEDQVLDKINAAHRAGKVIDGHAPALSGSSLQAYLSTGISTDHETLTAAEALEKIRAGMKIIIRHGSATSSLAELLPLLSNITVDSFMLGSDDREAGDLLAKGHINDILRESISLGGNPLLLIKAATINPARHYRLFDRGAIAPGYRADLAVFEDLHDFKTVLVIKDGQVAARDGKVTVPVDQPELPAKILKTINIGRIIEAQNFSISYPPGQVPVIGVVPGQLVTDKLFVDLERNADGTVFLKPTDPINRIAVVERHTASGRLALGLIRGFGLKGGAIASTVAHDSHNIIVVGVEEQAMASAVNVLAAEGGGFVVVNASGNVLSFLALPVAGLMSTEPATVVAEKMEKLNQAAYGLGAGLAQPFLVLSFMALPVIPSLKITDRGLFDVDSFKFL